MNVICAIGLMRMLVRTSLFAVVMLAAITGSSPSLSGQTAPALDPVRVWNKLALKTVSVKNRSDAQAARLYAMVNVAIYDAVNGIVSRHGEHVGREHVLVPSTDAPPEGDLYAAASSAAHAVLAGEFPELAGGFPD